MTNILINKLDILLYLKQNPGWISAFATGEGCFTTSYVISNRALWGFWPQLEFSVTQSLIDLELLQAIKEYFGDIGGVYDKGTGIGVYKVRSLTDLSSVIVPYFNQYPPLGRKAINYNIWLEALELISLKAHVEASLSSRDVLVKYLILTKKLNVSDAKANARKLQRLDVIINWLNSLNKIPSIHDKNQLHRMLSNL